MNYEEDHQERYADRKKKSQRMDLESLKQRLFPGEGDRFEQLLKEYRLIQKERRNDIPIDESAINPINEHKNRYLSCIKGGVSKTRNAFLFTRPWLSNYFPSFIDIIIFLLLLLLVLLPPTQNIALSISQNVHFSPSSSCVRIGCRCYSQIAPCSLHLDQTSNWVIFHTAKFSALLFSCSHVYEPPIAIPMSSPSRTQQWSSNPLKVLLDPSTLTPISSQISLHQYRSSFSCLI